MTNRTTLFDPTSYRPDPAKQWEEFIVRTLADTIFKQELNPVPEAAKARRRQLAEMGVPTIARQPNTAERIYQGLLKVADFVSPFVEPVDPETGLPNIDVAKTAFAKRGIPEAIARMTAKERTSELLDVIKVKDEILKRLSRIPPPTEAVMLPPTGGPLKFQQIKTMHPEQAAITRMHIIMSGRTVPSKTEITELERIREAVAKNRAEFPIPEFEKLPPLQRDISYIKARPAEYVDVLRNPQDPLPEIKKLIDQMSPDRRTIEIVSKNIEYNIPIVRKAILEGDETAARRVMSMLDYQFRRAPLEEGIPPYTPQEILAAYPKGDLVVGAISKSGKPVTAAVDAVSGVKVKAKEGMTRRDALKGIGGGPLAVSQALKGNKPADLLEYRLKRRYPGIDIEVKEGMLYKLKAESGHREHGLPVIIERTYKSYDPDDMKAMKTTLGWSNKRGWKTDVEKKQGFVVEVRDPERYDEFEIVIDNPNIPLDSPDLDVLKQMWEDKMLDAVLELRSGIRDILDELYGASARQLADVVSKARAGLLFDKLKTEKRLDDLLFHERITNKGVTKPK